MRILECPINYTFFLSLGGNAIALAVDWYYLLHGDSSILKDLFGMMGFRSQWFEAKPSINLWECFSSSQKPLTVIVTGSNKNILWKFDNIRITMI